MIRTLGFGAVIALLVQGALFSSRAFGKDWVSVQVDACVGADANAIQRLVDIELLSTPNGSARSEAIATDVTVDCWDRLVRILVNDHVTGKSLQRDVDVESTPKSLRPRLIALAIAELVVASWVELEITPAPLVQSARVTVPQRTRAEVTKFIRRRTARVKVRRNWAISLAGELTGFNTDFVLRGGQLSIAYLMTPRWRFSLATTAQYGVRDVQLGELRAFAITGTFSPTDRRSKKRERGCPFTSSLNLL